MERTEQLKMAFVGCGLIARAHWKGVREYAPLIKVTAVIDTDRERAEEMAAKTGGRAFYSLEEALAGGDFDAVDIMLPHNQHEATAVRAFGAGKHVLLEKPMSTTLESCDRILAAAKAAGTVFMVAEQSEYWSDAVAVRQLIRDGALGDIITARSIFGGSTPFPLGDSPKPWRYDKEVAGGGIVIDGGSHWIRPLRMWLGEIDEVVATLGYPLAEMDGESLARALCRFKSGAVAVFLDWDWTIFHMPCWRGDPWRQALSIHWVSYARRWRCTARWRAGDGRRYGSRGGILDESEVRPRIQTRSESNRPESRLFDGSWLRTPIKGAV